MVVPFVIAVGFVLVARVTLVEHFGRATGYWLVAVRLVAIGIVAAITVSVKEHEEGVAEHDHKTFTQHLGSVHAHLGSVGGRL